MGDDGRDSTLSLNTGKPPTDAGWLVVDAGTAEERKVPVGKQAISIGKASGAGLRLLDPHVSSRHAEVVRTAKGFVITDLGSRNGTQVDGVEIQSAVLEPGAMITVGTTTLRFETNVRRAQTPERTTDDGPSQFGDAYGEAPAMRKVFGVLSRLARADITVCVLGETGTGKEVIARAIHSNSPRADKRFVVIDCGAVNKNLIQSQLFGHVRGAFTGALADRPGAFERAHQGTVFIDEIGELALDLQPKLLRVLEAGRVTRLGATSDRAVDVRIVAATNRDLEKEVAAGRFREDLWFRLSPAVVTLPPLRERRQDLPELIRRFAGQAQPGLEVSGEAIDILKNHRWPGNVRELKNVIDGASAMCEDGVLKPRDFVLFRASEPEPTLNQLPLAGKSLDELERAAIEQSLVHFEGNKTKVAEALGIAPSTLYAKIKKYGL